MQEEEPEEQTTPRPDRSERIESSLGEGAEEFLAAELTEVAHREGDPESEVGVNPLPLPDVPEPIEEFDPNPIFREPTQVEMDPDPVLRVESELPVVEFSNLPIPIPDPGMEAGFGEEVSSDPIPIPDPGMEAGFGEEVSGLPVPTPDPDLIPENDLLEEEAFEEPLDMG